MPYVAAASAWVFSRPDYAWEGLDPARITVIPPSIDAFSPKNHPLSFASITAVLRAAGLAADHHHPFRAVFERLDGSTGQVTRAARSSRRNRCGSIRRSSRRSPAGIG